jgi:hypothetical protein
MIKTTAGKVSAGTGTATTFLAPVTIVGDGFGLRLRAVDHLHPLCHFLLDHCASLSLFLSHYFKQVPRSDQRV